MNKVCLLKVGGLGKLNNLGQVCCGVVQARKEGGFSDREQEVVGSRVQKRAGVVANES